MQCLHKHIRVKKAVFSVVLLVNLILGQTEIPVMAADKMLPSGVSYSDIEKTFDDYYEENKNNTAGAAIAIFDRQGTVFQKSYGYSDIENQLEIDDDTVFDWGSVTKTLVWVSVMRLEEQGKIDLDEDIREYLPDDFFSKLMFDTPITMNMLMNHNAGWQECVEVWINDKEDIKPLGEALQEMEAEQVFEPGTIQAYSNYGVAVAGYVVECVTGIPFDEYVKTNIFEPLGMEHTSISPTFDDNSWVGEKRMDLKCYDSDNQPLGNGFSYIAFYPAGSAVGTIDDFVTYGKAFLTEGGQTTPLFKDNKTLEEMLNPSDYSGKTEYAACCHGLWVLHAKNEVYWHNGGSNGCTSFLGFDTESGVGYAVLTNQCDESIYTENSINMVFGERNFDEYNCDANTEKVKQDEINGIYLGAQTIISGHFKICGVFSLVSVNAAENGDLIIKPCLLPFDETRLYKIGENTYASGGMIIGVFEDVNGITHIDRLSDEYIKLNSIGAQIQVILVYLLVITVLFAVISLFAGGISFLINRCRKRKLNLSPECIGKITVNAAIILAALNVLIEFNDPYKASAWQFMLTGLFGLIPIGYIVIFIMRSKKECTKAEKIRYILTAVMGMFLTVNIGYWEMYKFW